MKVIIKNTKTNTVQIETEAASFIAAIEKYGANLYGANLCGADLRGANLCEADLCEAHLRGADLRGARINTNQKETIIKSLELHVEEPAGEMSCG